MRATFLIPPRGLEEKKGVQQVRVLDKRYDIDVYSLVKSGQIPSSEEVRPQEDIFKKCMLVVGIIQQLQFNFQLAFRTILISYELAWNIALVKVVRAHVSCF